MQNSGDEISWNYMFEKYQETSLAQEKEKLLYGLASVRNITLLDRWFKHTEISLFLQKQLVTVCSFPSSSVLSVLSFWSDYRMRYATYFQDQLSNMPLWDCTTAGKKPCSFSGKTFVAVLGQGDISKHHPRGGHITPKHFWDVPGRLNVCVACSLSPRF